VRNSQEREEKREELEGKQRKCSEGQIIAKVTIVCEIKEKQEERREKSKKKGEGKARRKAKEKQEERRRKSSGLKYVCTSYKDSRE
jgi:hypothetical protein